MKDSFTYYKENNLYQKAFNYSDKKANYYLSKKDFSKYIKHTNNKTTVLTNDIQDPKRSLKIIYESFTRLKKAPDFEKVKLYPELARTYIELNHFQKGIEIVEKGLKLASQTKNDSINLRLNFIVLSAYLSMQDTQNAFRYLEPSLKYAKKTKDNQKIAEAYNHHFAFYSFIKERDIAKKYLDSALIYAEKSKVKNTVNTIKSNLGVHYLTEDIDYKKARDLYLELIATNKNDSLSDILSNSFLNISLAYEKLGDIQSANKYLNKYTEYIEYALQNKYDNEIEGIRTKYELEKAESRYNKDKFLLKQKQLKSEKTLYIMIALLAVAGILFYFFFQNLKLKQKNKLKDIHNTLQQKLVNATIDGQEEERKRISGVLHDNISALLSSANLHLTAFEVNHPEIEGELKKTKEILKEAHNKVRDLSHELIPPVLEKLGLIAALEDLCEKNSNTLIHFNFDNSIKDTIIAQNEFEMKLYFIVVELFNNIIKHSNATEASLKIDKKGNQLILKIEDNGSGFISKEGRFADGLGLSQIKSRLKNLKGTITINSDDKNGTNISLTVPLS